VNQWNNEDLRKRQSAGDVGFLRPNPGIGRRRWRGLLIPAVVTVAGLVLLYVGPLPGLGMFLFIGGIVAAFVTFIMGYLGD
jgi:hypothetical protein